MKKLTKVLALVAMAAALFIGCSNSSSSSGNGGDSGTGAPKPDTLELFKDDAGKMITTNAGKYDTFIELDKEYDGTGYSKIVVEFKGGVISSKTVQYQFQAQDADGTPACEFTVPLAEVTDFTAKEGAFGAPNKYTDWNDNGKEKTMSSKIAKLRVVTQQGQADSWNPPAGDTVYVKSITLKK